MDTPVFFHQNTYKHRHKHSFHFIQAAQLDDSWCPKNGYPDARYNVSTNGWGDGGTFNDWFLHHFVSNLKHEKRPILLITDGYKSHISTKIIKIALDHHVHVECLPPHSTTLLQPLDVVTLSKVAELFKNSILPSHCASGFLKSGFYPYDPPVISKEKLLEPPTVMTSFSYQHVACSNSIDKSFSNFNDLALRACPSTTRLSSCPNILLTGCPQGSIFSPTLFITFNSDMGNFLGDCMSHFFADDLAAILAGNIGSKFTSQCIDLERKLKLFLENLEFYSILTSQPINYNKAEGLRSARAIGAPKFDIANGENKIQWTKNSNISVIGSLPNLALLLP
ncbi:unnamed protein product [Rotaria magnacalcarata]|uniref:DDE-1 domain-containing protein n=1 Tax=Rotaria magnacalcarata TaxID=392030 RepID=A0A815F1T1_9BILA|nr:unnamed protein product [Rotaria magnacalcarata]